jgi:hypothetical protein
MHFDFLIEDLSGKEMLNLLLPKLIDESHTYSIKYYKGIGHLPKNLKSKPEPNKRVLLNQLPRLIQGFGNTHKGYGESYEAVLIIIVDLDAKDKNNFLVELNTVLENCSPQPLTYFCLAIEEGEAWFLGDKEAIKKAYPDAKLQILSRYTPDTICGTWELLADAIYSGGVSKLKSKGSGEVGKEKSNWSKKITPYMNIDQNSSPSFCYFRDMVIKLRSSL